MNIGKEFVLLFSVLFLPGMLAQVGNVDPAAFGQTLYNLEILATAIPQILLVVVVAGYSVPGSPLGFGWQRPRWRDATGALVIFVVVWIVAVSISTISALFPGGPRPSVAWTFDRPALIPLAFLSTLAIGYREEIFFRAYLSDRAERLGVDTRLALPGGALLFAAGHLYQGVIGALIALAIGLVLCAAYVRTRSLHAVSIAHGLYNFTVLLTSLSS